VFERPFGRHAVTPAVMYPAIGCRTVAMSAASQRIRRLYHRYSQSGGLSKAKLRSFCSL
jgi:hypothetical protein